MATVVSLVVAFSGCSEERWADLDAAPYAPRACAVNSALEVRCWGAHSCSSGCDDPAPTPLPVPDGLQVQAVSTDGLLSCGLDPDGAIECWGYPEFEDGSPWPGPWEGGFTDVTVGGRWVCGSSGPDVDCLDWTDGSAVHFAGWSEVWLGTFSPWGICGLEAATGLLDCPHEPRWTPPAEPMLTFDAVDGWGCGVRPDRSLLCWGDTAEAELLPPAGAFSSVSVGAFHACALRTDQTAVCWGSNEGSLNGVGGQLDVPEERFVELALSRDVSCGITTSGELVCWGSTYGDLLETPLLAD